MELKLVIVALCAVCVAADDHWPANLKAVLGDSVGDYVDVKLTWDAGTKCFLFQYQHDIFIGTPYQPARHVGATQTTNFTIQKVEYWTNYTITLESRCLFSRNISTFINTGPGNPHKVSNVTVRPSTFNATMDISEALAMPRVVDEYNVTVCIASTGGPCFSQVIVRNTVSENLGGTNVTTQLKGLLPFTKYNVTVKPKIHFEAEEFVGQPFEVSFTTDKYTYPVPHNFSQNSTVTNHLAAIDVRWQIDEPNELSLVLFNITLKNRKGQVIFSTTTTERKVRFVDIPLFSKFRAEVVPVFNISNYIHDGDAGIYEFLSPRDDVGPPRNFQFASLDPSRALLGWDAPDNTAHVTVHYNVSYCLEENCTSVNSLSDRRLMLSQLTPKVVYKVQIVPTITDEAGEDYVGKALTTTFTTLDKDWPAVTRVAYSRADSTSDSVSFAVSWTADKLPELANFEVSACDMGCTRTKTKDLSTRINLSYYRNYTLAVSAQYSLPLDVLVVRNSTPTTLVTPGVEPGHVTNVTVVNVTSDSVQLQWKAPSNLPSSVQSVYLILDSNEDLVESSFTNTYVLTHLRTYHTYNVSIQAHASYGGVTYTGIDTFFTFKTDVGTPSHVRYLKAVQDAKFNTFDVSWEAPPADQCNGPIDFYIVRVFNDSNVKISESRVFGSTNLIVAVPFVKQANYRITVSAVNIDIKNQTHVGDESNLLVQFHGYVAPVDLRMLNRTSTSVLVEILAREQSLISQHEKLTQFYEVELVSTGRTVTSVTPLINVTSLAPFTTENVHVRACYQATFCSADVAAKLATNVGGPSAVEDFKGWVHRKTTPSFVWTKPQTLNGPLDGYQLHLVDGTLERNFTLPPHITEFAYETRSEYETYALTVTPFNFDLDVARKRVLGVSSKVLVTTSGTHVPKPFNLTQGKLDQTNIDLSWTRPDFPDFNVNWYRVELENTDIDQMVETTSITLTGLTPYGRWTAYVRGCTGSRSRECGYPRELSVQTDAGAPSAPLALTVRNLTRNTALLEWHAPAVLNGPLSGYSLAVFESENRQPFKQIDVGGNSLKYELAGLNNNTVYTVEMRAYNVDSYSVKQMSANTVIQFTTDLKRRFWTSRGRHL